MVAALETQTSSSWAQRLWLYIGVERTECEAHRMNAGATERRTRRRRLPRESPPVQWDQSWCETVSSEAVCGEWWGRAGQRSCWQALG